MSSRDNRWRSVETFPASLESAQGGCSESLGKLLDGCRQYLLLIANQELDRRVAAKAGASDLVQETFLAARRHFEGFQGATRGELLAWLRQILLNHLADVQRRYWEAGKRDSRREVSLERFFYSAVEALTADTPSPSSHLMREELAEAVDAAVIRLPERYRTVIRLRYRERLAFQDVAQQLELTEAAARQLWARAIGRLRRELRGLE